MTSVLVPVDGSAAADREVKAVARKAQMGEIDTIHLVNVQPHLGAYVGRFIATGRIRAFQRERGERQLEVAMRLCFWAGVRAIPHIYVGDRKRVVIQAARQLNVDGVIGG